MRKSKTDPILGAIARGRKVLPDREAMREGDILLGLASSGCHSNGFSLIRKIVVERAGLSYTDPAPWDQSTTVGESLLTPTRIYVRSLLPAIERSLVKGMAHITGGGLVENVPRMLPPHLGADLDASRWQCPGVLRWLKKAGGVDDGEFVRVFNAGLGMVLVVDPGLEEEATRVLLGAGEKVFSVGRLVGRQDGGMGCVVRNVDGLND